MNHQLPRALSGQKLGGLYSADSFASSSPHGEEIYVEQLWRVDQQGKFVECVEQTAGAIVRADECHFIEFFGIEEQGRERQIERVSTAS